MERVLYHVRMILKQPGFPGLLTANFALGMAYSFVVPFMSMWGTLEVRMTPVLFGTFMTITWVSAIVLSTLLARWSDSHVPRRTMLILGSLGGILGYAGYAFVRDPLALIFIGSLGLGMAAVNFSQLFAHLREEFSRPENAGVDARFLMSVMRVAFSLAWTVGPAIGAWVMVHFHYRGIFLGASGLFLIFLCGVLLFVPHRPHPPHARNVARNSFSAVWQTRELLVSIAALVLIFSAHAINMMNMPLMVTTELGGTERDVGIIYGIAPFIEIPIMIWSGRSAAGGRQLSFIRIGAGATVLYFLSLTAVHAPTHIYPMQALSAVSIAILTTVPILFFQDLLPGQPGLATSLYSNSFSAGNLIGYFAFGSLLLPLGHRGLFIFCAGLCLAAVVLLSLLRFLHRPSS